MRCCVKIIVNKAQYMVMKTNTFLSSMGFFNSVFFLKTALTVHNMGKHWSLSVTIQIKATDQHVSCVTLNMLCKVNMPFKLFNLRIKHFD